MAKQEILDRLSVTAEATDTILSHFDGDAMALARKLIADLFDGLADEINDAESDEDEPACCGDPECCDDEESPDEYVIAIPFGSTFTLTLPRD